MSVLLDDRTIPQTTPAEREAFEEGRQARREGLGFKANTYPPGSERMAWPGGWFSEAHSERDLCQKCQRPEDDHARTCVRGQHWDEDSPAWFIAAQLR